jgi:hypothetical protein
MVKLIERCFLKEKKITNILFPLFVGEDFYCIGLAKAKYV